jgi:O-antigen/teichoic acid export membrane protein
VAYYAVAKKLAYSVLVLTDPLMNSVFPQFSKLLAAKKFNEIRIMLNRMTRFSLAPAVAGLILSWLLSDWIIALVYGDEYSAAGRSFFWHSAGAIFSTVVFWSLPLVQSLGLVNQRLLAYCAAIAVGCVAAFLLIPTFLAAGMAMALLSATITIGILFLFFIREKMSALQGKAV